MAKSNTKTNLLYAGVYMKDSLLILYAGVYMKDSLLILYAGVYMKDSLLILRLIYKFSSERCKIKYKLRFGKS